MGKEMYETISTLARYFDIAANEVSEEVFSNFEPVCSNPLLFSIYSAPHIAHLLSSVSSSIVRDVRKLTELG